MQASSVTFPSSNTYIGDVVSPKALIEKALLHATDAFNTMRGTDNEAPSYYHAGAALRQAEAGLQVLSGVQVPSVSPRYKRIADAATERIWNAVDSLTLYQAGVRIQFGDGIVRRAELPADLQVTLNRACSELAAAASKLG